MATFWESLPHTVTLDKREPSFTFEVGGEQYGFYNMNPLAWVEVLALMSLQTGVFAVLSTLLYKYSVNKPLGKGVAYFLCYAVIIPIMYSTPVILFVTLGIQNQFMRFCIAAMHPLTCMMKASGAAHGFTPKDATTSLSNFVFWFISPFPMVYDKKLDKPAPATSQDLVELLTNFLKFLVIFGLFESGVRVFHDELRVITHKAHGPLGPDSDWYSLSRTLSLQNALYPHFAVYGFTIIFIFSVLSFGLGGTQLLLTWKKVETFVDNPAFTSRSMSDFWSSKYNAAMSDCLKIGVFKPVRSVGPTWAAVVATFFVSGLLHEGLVLAMTAPLDDREGCYSDPEGNKHKVECHIPQLFGATVFLVYVGFVVAIEKIFLKDIKVPLPSWVIGPFICLIMSFVGHWFIEPYWNSMVLDSGMILFFFVKPIK